MFDKILEYSQQPYLVVWSALMIIFGFLTILSFITGLGADVDVDFDADFDISGGHTFWEGISIFFNVGTVPQHDPSGTIVVDVTWASTDEHLGKTIDDRQRAVNRLQTLGAPDRLAANHNKVV